jgi:hypothetical protein
MVTGIAARNILIITLAVNMPGLLCQISLKKAGRFFKA